MRRIKVVGLAVIAVLAMSVTTTGAASAAKLTLSEGGVALAPGDYFELWGSNNLGVSTSDESIECPDDPYTGLDVNVLTSSKGMDELEIESMFGTGLACRSEFGNADVYLGSIGKTLKLRSNGKASSGAASMSIDYEWVEYHEQRYDDVSCSFTAKRLTGSNTATASRQGLEVGLGGEFRLESASSSDSEHAKRLCPKTAGLELSLPNTEGETGGEVEEQT
jgi:hypothetical protein